MKKSIIIVILIGSLIGLIFGQIIFKNYKGKEYLNETGNIYYIQYGVYTSNEAALKNSSSLDNYKIVENDDKYYVYLGITSNYDIALKTQEMYKNMGIYSYKIKEYDNTLKDLDNYQDIKEVFKEIFQEQDLSL